jgi:tetratricopeptide (TPR) repeat protein
MDPEQRSLSDLERAVMEAYLQEADSSTHYQRKASSATLTVKDLELDVGVSTSRHETLKLEVLEAWRKLVYMMNKDGVFLEYTENLWKAFSVISSADRSLYRVLHTLSNLLVNTAENKGRDESTECRFITLVEVILSYGEEWSPSDEVAQSWVRLMQRIPSDVPAVNFRRKAYRVLVSLSWVPSSRGLLDACSFEEARQRIDSSKSPARVGRHIDKIRGQPQPRFDFVNQVLDRLKDETDVRVAITAEREGMGKTTLAALVASHPSILRVFKVVWLDIDGETLTYERYMVLLQELCDQLGTSLDLQKPNKNLEEPALKRLREQAFMTSARNQMSEALEERDENILLVLDDVIDGSLVDWFRFNERQSIIVTTPTVLEGVDWTVDLGYLSEEEAIELFLVEANFPSDHVLGLTVEIRKITTLCERHPLTIRTAARWYYLKAVTAGIKHGMAELVRDLSLLKESEDDNMVLSTSGESSDDGSRKVGKSTTPFIYEVLSLLLGPCRLDEGMNQATILFFICLASMVAIFPKQTPLDIVLLLWEQILKSDSHAVEEVSKSEESLPPTQLKKLALKQAVLVAEGLTHMGVISITEHNGQAVVEVHHKIYAEFALFMAQEMDLAETEQETIQNWNKAFVTAYFTQKIQGNMAQVDSNSWEYTIRRLPTHIFQARMFPIAEKVLGEDQFLQSRINSLGWDKAIDMHLDDCMQLQQKFDTDSEEETGQAPRLSSVFEQMATVFSDMMDKEPENSDLKLAIAMVLCDIGVALAESCHYDAATDYLERAWNMSPPVEELQARILYFSAWVQLSVNQSDRALKMVRGSRKVIEEYMPDDELLYDVLQLQGEAIVGECEYRDAVSFFQDVCETLRLNAESHQSLFGVLLFKKGVVQQTMGELETAKASFLECVDLMKASGATSRSLSMAYKALGDICVERRKPNEAKEYYECGIEVLDSLKTGPGDVDHLLLTGKLRLLRKDFNACIDVLKRARTLIKDKPNVFLDQSAADLRCIARAYHESGDLNEAVLVLQDSLALTDQRLYSLERSACLHELATVLLDQDQPTEGLICFEQSLEIRILKLGECVQLLDTLNAIGNVHLSLGANEEALTVFYKVDELTRRIAPDDIERIAGVLYSIGEVHDAQKDFTGAIAKFNECMEILRQKRGKDHPHIAKALQRLGDVTVLQNDLDKASEFYAAALRIRRLDSDERNLAETLHCMGVLARKQTQLDVASDCLMEALKIRQRLENGREAGETLLEFGHIQRLQGETEDAISLYEKSLEVLDRNDDIRGCAYLSLGHANMSEKLDRIALSYYEQALEVRRAAYGKNNIKTGNVSRSLGVIKYLLNNGDESLVHLNEFVRVIELNDDEDNAEECNDIDYLIAVLLMFDIHRANGRMEQAKNLIEVAQDVCEESETVLKAVPVLIKMTERRVKELAEKVTHKEPEKETKKGLLARLNLANEEGILGKMILDFSECDALRNIRFIDD